MRCGGIKIVYFLLVLGLGDGVRCSDVSGSSVGIVGQEAMSALADVLGKNEFSIPSVLTRFQILHSQMTKSLLNNTLPYLNCSASLLDVLLGAKKFQLWALRMVDASSKIPTGLLEGNLLDLGQFDECVNIDRTDAEYTSYVGQHCLVQFIFNISSFVNMTVVVNGAKIKLVDLLGGTSIKLTLSQCLPSTCQPYMIEEAFDHIFVLINALLADKNITLKAVINPSDCHVKDRGPLHTEDWIVICVCGVLVLFAIISTLVDILLLREKTPTVAERLLVAFSLKANSKKLFSTKVNMDQMGAINGMKFFSIAWVVLGHRYRYSVQQPLVNLLQIPDLMKDWTKMFLLNATLSVDTFFLISGLLNAYTFFNLMAKKRRYTVIDLIVTYVHRYIRLTPAYMIMIAVTGTWLYRVGNGPIWDRLVGQARGYCQDTWWSNIIYLNNYLNPNHNCMMQSWYLAADMQMFWLAPFVIYPLWRWPIFGLVELFILTALSIASPTCISYFYDIREPIPISNDEEKVAREMDMLYLPTHTKTISYVVGIFAGYVLQKARTKRIRLPFNIWTVLAGWVVGAICLLYALFGCYWLFQPNNPYTKLESSLYLGFYRFFWSIGVSWVIITCVMGYGGFVNTILSWSPFGPLGRLTYCIYLTHIAVVIYKMGSVRTSMYLDDYGQVEQFLGDLFFSILAAIILSLLMESPILTIEKMIFGHSRPKARSESRDTPRHSQQPPAQNGPSAPEEREISTNL